MVSNKGSPITELNGLTIASMSLLVKLEDTSFIVKLLAFSSFSNNADILLNSAGNRVPERIAAPTLPLSLPYLASASLIDIPKILENSEFASSSVIAPLRIA